MAKRGETTAPLAPMVALPQNIPMFKKQPKCDKNGILVTLLHWG